MNGASALRLDLSHQAHVWWATTDEVAAFAARQPVEGWLTDDEWVRYRRYRRARDRDLFLHGRAVLRHTLSRYEDVHPGAWRFATGPHGRPEVDGPLSDGTLRFNLSHTHGLIVCLVCGRIDGGVDVEYLDRALDPLKLAATVCSAQERDELTGLSPDAVRERFYELWTLKESYVKARGEGLTIPLRHVSFTGSGDGPISVRFDSSIGDEPGGWRFRSWRPLQGFQGAVALRPGPGPDPEVVIRQALPGL